MDIDRELLKALAEQHEEETTIEIIMEDFDLADFLPADHQVNDPDCVCAACTYPLS